MKVLIAIFFGLIALTRCASSPSMLRPDCHTPSGLQLLPASGLVTFGELHGTVESPQFVSRVACAMSSAGGPVVVALEWPSDLQPSIDEYINLPTADISRVTSNAFFNGSNDGRASGAMIQLVRDIKKLRTNGANISIAAFDAGRNASPSNRDASRDVMMAMNLRDVLQKNSNALVLALTGNIHSRIVRGVAWNAALEPMMFHLRDLSTLSLNVLHETGSAWVCSNSECGPKAFRGNAEFREIAPNRSVGLALDSLTEGHNGYYYVGKLSPSSPFNK